MKRQKAKGLQRENESARSVRPDRRMFQCSRRVQSLSLRLFLPSRPLLQSPVRNRPSRCRRLKSHTRK